MRFAALLAAAGAAIWLIVRAARVNYGNARRRTRDQIDSTSDAEAPPTRSGVPSKIERSGRSESQVEMRSVGANIEASRVLESHATAIVEPDFTPGPQNERLASSAIMIPANTVPGSPLAGYSAPPHESLPGNEAQCGVGPDGIPVTSSTEASVIAPHIEPGANEAGLANEKEQLQEIRQRTAATLTQTPRSINQSELTDVTPIDGETPTAVEEPKPTFNVHQDLRRTIVTSVPVEDTRDSQNNGAAMSKSIAPSADAIPPIELGMGVEASASPVPEPVQRGSESISHAPSGAEIPTTMAELPAGLETAHGLTHTNKLLGPTEEQPDGRSVARNQKTKKRLRPAKYQAPVRTRDLPSPGRQSRAELATGTAQLRARSVALHAIAEGRNRYKITLLPERRDDLPKIITVQGPKGFEKWTALQPEWYADFIPPGLGTILREGAQWEADDGNGLRWALAGRDIYVLTGNSEGGIYAFITTTRLLLNENHLVLCTREVETAVALALRDAGCANTKTVYENAGIPPGWALFTGVRPTKALPHNPADGIFNALRPVEALEIELQGGIRVERDKWLYGYPRQIRVAGEHDNIELFIDNRLASRDEQGSYRVEGYQHIGVHRVFCGGVFESYEIIPPPDDWEPFSAFLFGKTAAIASPLAVCGPRVWALGRRQTVFMNRSGRTCLLGALPGQIAFVEARFNGQIPASLAEADFPIVWAVPAVPLLADKQASTILLLQHVSPTPLGAQMRTRVKPWAQLIMDRQTRRRVKVWAQSIMDASYKHIRIEPDTDDARRLWTQYKETARLIKRSLS